MDGIVHTFQQLTTVGSDIGLAAATFFILLGGFQYMTASGNPMAMERAKAALRNAVVGYAIVLLANALASLISNSINPPAHP
jgi:hypothetical protein